MGSSPPPCSFNSRVSSLSSSLFLQFKSVLLLLLLVPSIQECPPSPPSCSFNSRVSSLSSSLFLHFRRVLLLILLVRIQEIGQAYASSPYATLPRLYLPKTVVLEVAARVK